MAAMMMTTTAVCVSAPRANAASSGATSGFKVAVRGARVSVPARMQTVRRSTQALTTARLLPAELPAGVTVEKMGKDVFNSTYYPRGEDTDCSRKPWIVIDAAGLRLGRVSTLIATYLRGGNVATYSPSMNMGTYVVVINAEQILVSGKKFEDKLYRRHPTGRPGSMKIESFKALQARIPERIVEKAVRGMLPKNRMGRELFTQLKVYEGEAHPHAAQNPVDVTAEVKARCYSARMMK
mmetsp:Transcript_13577/g.22221  ORF Transcript_13577/g.22221 Transcript_13577/m.22221 type:complete len:238 (+) Transcript_13577:78-791(+)